MTTIDTSEDIIRALQEDPRLLRQVRRAIMTDEVLALPDQFADMRETQNSMLETQNRILSELADTRSDAALHTGNPEFHAGNCRVPCWKPRTES